MSLISTFPSTPAARAYFRKVDEALTVTYSRQRISGSWGWTNNMNAGGTYAYMNEYHRYARKRYRYVGMTDAAKNACVKAMTSLYTRQTWTNEWQESGGSWSGAIRQGDMPLATITPISNDDGSWDVQIDVNEDDVRHSMDTQSSDPKFMFLSGYERAREYDGETEADLEPPSENS